MRHAGHLHVRQGGAHHPRVECGADVLRDGDPVHVGGLRDIAGRSGAAPPDGDVRPGGPQAVRQGPEPPGPAEEVQASEECGARVGDVLRRLRRSADHDLALVDQVEGLRRKVFPVPLVGGEPDVPEDDLHRIGGVGDGPAGRLRVFRAGAVPGEDQEFGHDQRSLSARPA